MFISDYAIARVHSGHLNASARWPKTHSQTPDLSF